MQQCTNKQKLVQLKMHFVKMYFPVILIVALLNNGYIKCSVENDKLNKHYPNSEQHNVEYDHEAFLGEEAKVFDQLAPEESQRRLGVIVDKIDNNNDGFISKEELRDWIRFTQKRYIIEDVQRQWKQHNPNNNDTLDWSTYQKLVYGFLESVYAENANNSENVQYRQMLKRDRRRWSVADTNEDDALTFEEFTNFLHPEESEHMRDIVVQETMEDIDKDNDGRVSLKEYIGDIYRDDQSDDEVPDWVVKEREEFRLYRDTDGDGYMDKDQVRQWILPENFDHAEAEARHLIYEADSDADELLTKDEILNKYDLFVGSQATDFGEALIRHDEF